MAIQKNIMSVDLEDNYCDLPFSFWNNYESTLESPTRIILRLFRKYNVLATFFTLGHTAKRHPELIEEIRAEGHELASHGYSHINLKKMGKEGFESDLAKSVRTIEKISGEKVLGFRAPYFSVNRCQPWAFEVMKKYLKYDSSIFPVKPHYNLGGAPRHIYRISDRDPLEEDCSSNFVEIPMATLHLPLVGNIPIAGGVYLRFLPYRIISLGIRKLNECQLPAMCYIHPEDLNPERQRIPGYSWHYYCGLKGAIKKFEYLLANFTFSSVREVVPL